MHEGAHFYWLSLFSVPEEMNHVVMAIVVGVVVIIGAWIARGQLKRAMTDPVEGLIPDSKVTFRNFFEIIAELIYKLSVDIIGEHETPTYFPLVGTLFVYIVACNLVGLIPGMLPPTDNMNTTFAMGIFVFVAYNVAGIRVHGIGYLKHFMGPVWYLAPLMLVIEVFSHIFRPLSLALRLKGNIMGDHIVLGIFSGLVPYIVPVAFYALGLFVACIQAFVFSLLTMVYISLATSHDH